MEEKQGTGGIGGREGDKRGKNGVTAGKKHERKKEKT